MENDLDLEPLSERTIRVEAVTIPPEAMPDATTEMLVDEDGPTLVVVPSAIAALAARSAEATPSASPRRSRAEDEHAMRRAVFGIWAVAAVLLATLGMLVK